MGRTTRSAASALQGCSIAALMMGAAGTAQAATAAAPTEIQELIVTASRREARLQDVPLAVTALDKGMVDAAGVIDAKTLQTSTPGLNISTSGASQFVFLRGVGSVVFGVFSDNSVASYIDGVYVPRQTSANQAFNDIERVEVLRGPQATLYGRNATGGAILVTSKAPSRSYEFDGDVQFGNYDLRRFRAAVGGPLGDRFAARLSVVRSKRDGYSTNLTDGSTYDSQNLWAVRGAVTVDLTDDAHVTLRGHYSDEKGSPGAMKAIDPRSPQFSVLGAPFSSDPRASYHNLTNQNPQKNSGASLHFDLALPGAQLKLISAVDRYDLGASVLDLDDSNASLLEQRGENGRTDAAFHDLLITSDQPDSRLEWLVGATYFHEKTNDATAFRIPVASPLPFGPRFPQAINATQYASSARAFGVFGQVGYAITPTLKLVTGVRYSEERKRGVNSVVTTINFPAPIGTRVTRFSADNSKTWTDVSPKVGIEYRPKERTLIYGSVTKGFKSGAFDPQNVDTTADPEKLVSYEAGLKTEVLGGHLLLNLAAFHYDYKDIQVFQGFIDPSTGALRTFLTNAAKAKVDGLEAEVVAAPASGLQLGLRATLLHARYGSGSRLADVANSVSALQDVDGNRMIQAPRIASTLFARYQAPIGDSGTAELYGEWFHQSERFFTAFEDPTMRAGPTDVLNGRITFTPRNGNWRVSVFGRNLGDKLIVSHMSRTPPILTGVTYAEPRTYGVELGVTFR